MFRIFHLPWWACWYCSWAAPTRRASVLRRPSSGDGRTDVGVAARSPNINLPAGLLQQDLVRRGAEEVLARIEYVNVTAGFFSFIGIPLLAGRELDEVRDLPAGQGAAAGPAPVMLNEAALRELGFSDPEEATGGILAQRYRNPRTGELLDTPLEIVGVVADSMYQSVTRRPAPESYRLQTSSNVILLRYDPARLEGLEARLREAITRSTGQPAQTFTFLDVAINNAFRQAANESRLLLICGILALLLACAGRCCVSGTSSG